VASYEGRTCGFVSGHDMQLCIRARLHRPLKNSASESFVTGHDFSRADKPFIFLPEPAFSRRHMTNKSTFSAACSVVPIRPSLSFPSRLQPAALLACPGRSVLGYWGASAPRQPGVSPLPLSCHPDEGCQPEEGVWRRCFLRLSSRRGLQPDEGSAVPFGRR